jgi:Ca-activated chloride channel family protein
MPNRGELQKEGLFSIAKEASKKDIHTTFIGIGVDFNNDLVEAVSKTKGANYYAIHSSQAFKKRLADEFDYMVTPLVYDLSLTLDSPDFSIQAVYGSPDANRSSGSIMYVNTLFPSPTTQEGTKGGVILLKLRKNHTGAKNLALSVSYHDRNKQHFKSQKSVQFNTGDYHDNSSIQKSILLARYVDLMKNFTMDMRKGCQDDVKRYHFQPFHLLKQHCALYPPDRPHFSSIKTWERKSCPLFVSAGYQKIFSLFSQHFRKEKAILQDDSLSKELDILSQLQKQKIVKEGKIDDWQGVGK